MVARIMIGKNIDGAIRYNENKVKKGKADLLVAQGLPKDTHDLSLFEKSAYFRELVSRNRSGKNCLHISLNFHNDDVLDQEKLREIVTVYMEKIGFADQPYLLYHVVNWGISNTMNAEWCKEIVEEAIVQYGKPEIFNTDQGSQFTSETFTGMLKSYEIKISMDGKGRALDNIWIERLWRSVKYEHIYLNIYEDGVSLSTCFKNFSIVTDLTFTVI